MAVLGTKVPIPTLRRDLVERDRLTARLIERLAGGDLPRLVLVSAAPGFGKTTVLARVSHPRLGELRTLPATMAIFRASAARARGDTDAMAQHARSALSLTGPTTTGPRGRRRQRQKSASASTSAPPWR